jgi:DNA-binding transcriptional regulator YdaS (Cro superfamily)
MDLKTYFKDKDNSQVEFAKAIGVTPGAVSQWANGATVVSANRCPEIERATGGLVRCEDLRPDVDWAFIRNQPKRKAKPELAAKAVA